MSYANMSLEEITRTLKNFSKVQTQLLLGNLTSSEHVFALKSTMFSLDARAQAIFTEQLEQERSKNQKQREELEALLQAMQTYFPDRTN